MSGDLGAPPYRTSSFSSLRMAILLLSYFTFPPVRPLSAVVAGRQRATGRLLGRPAISRFEIHACPGQAPGALPSGCGGEVEDGTVGNSSMGLDTH
ncbi:hypothetical protein ZWY2020_059452 [Hordeum vulgare]|nr:hypothetical protein ZWY2020_059452 [Hordeum vulgare]